MKKNGTEIERELIEFITKHADWDDLLKVYRAAINLDAELEEQDDGSYCITTRQHHEPNQRQ